VRITKELREGGLGSADSKELRGGEVIPGNGILSGPARMHKAHLRLSAIAQGSHPHRMLSADSLRTNRTKAQSSKELRDE